MSRTVFEPKVSSIGPQNETRSPTAETGPKTQTAGDLYTNGQADPYRRLISGAKASESLPVSEMIGEISNLAVARPHRDPIQNLLDGLVFGEDSANASDFEVPAVPDFYRHIMKKLPGVKIEAVIQKYKDLKKVIKNLKLEAEKTRTDPLAAVKMNAGELRALTDHIRQLDGQLIKSEKELDRARAYKVKLDAESAAEEANNA